MSPIPESVWLTGAAFIMQGSTMIAAGILHSRVFLAFPSVSSTAKGEASESLLKEEGIQIYAALLTCAAYLAVSRTLPPPKPIITFISSMHIFFAMATASSKLALPMAYISAFPKSMLRSVTFSL